MRSPTTGQQLPAYGTEAWWAHITDLMGRLKIDHPEQYQKLLDQTSSVIPADLIRRLDDYFPGPSQDPA